MLKPDLSSNKVFGEKALVTFEAAESLLRSREGKESCEILSGTLRRVALSTNGADQFPFLDLPMHNPARTLLRCVTKDPDLESWNLGAKTSSCCRRLLTGESCNCQVLWLQRTRSKVSN